MARPTTSYKGVYLRGVHLTPREWEIALLLAAGHHGKAIATSLGTSDSTVKVQLQNIYFKMRSRYPSDMANKDSRIILVTWVLEYSSTVVAVGGAAVTV